MLRVCVCELSVFKYASVFFLHTKHTVLPVVTIWWDNLIQGV